MEKIKIEILMSTMNKKNLDELELEKKNIFENCLIINQVTDEKIKLANEEIIEKNIRMFSFREKGLSKSRNRALENARGEIGLIFDDDLVLKNEYLENILKAFEENNDCDIITFQSEIPEGGLRKKYSIREYKHSLNSIRKVSSIEIAFKISSIKEKKINFDERFGCGAKFPAGEEIIFLSDAYKNGLKLKYIPLINSCHEIESTGNRINEQFSKEILEFKGALAKRIFPKIYKIVILLLYIKFLINKKIRKKDFFYLKNGSEII